MNQSDAAHDASIQRIGGIVMQVAGPALAMLVVYSIAGFLIEIFYDSALVGRVKWIFFLFSFAAVLISRISIEEGYERASGFGLVLGLAILLVSSRLLQGNPLFLAIILTFVWWAAGRLTWDCTFIDKSRDATGQGMIDLAIDRVEKFRKGERDEAHESKNEFEEPLLDPDLVQGPDEKNELTAWEKFVSIFWKRKQANTPGLWAFYFLLMGLPFFGLGQVMLRMTDQAAHNAAVMHFFWYITGLLGLLMLTSVLGLHRYLQDNQSSMPGSLARKWIIAGALLAFCITGFCLVLPRPSAQYSVGHWLPKLTSKNTKPSDQSFGDDGQEEGKNNSNGKTGPKSRDNRGQKKEGGDQNESKGGNERKSDQGAPKDTKGGEASGGKSDDGKKGAGGKQKENTRESSRGDSNDKSEQKGKQSGGKDKSEKGEPENEGQKSEKSKSGKQKKGNEKSGEKKSSEDKQGLKTDNQGNQKKKANQKKNRGRNSSKRRQRPPRDSQPNQNQQDSKKKEQQKEDKSNR